MIMRPRGFLKLLILKLLGEKPRHGYEIMDSIEKKIKWRPSAGAIYPKLQELEFEEFVEVKEEKIGDKTKKVDRLTEKGRVELKKIKQKKTEIKGKIDTWIDNASELVAFFWPEKELHAVKKEVDKLAKVAIDVSKDNLAKAVRLVKGTVKELEKL